MLIFLVEKALLKLKFVTSRKMSIWRETAQSEMNSIGLSLFLIARSSRVQTESRHPCSSSRQS